jgi:hypothetical protein
MKDLLILLTHLLTTIAKLLGPGGARAIVADSLLMKQQLLVINRSRRRAPNLSTLDRFLFGFWSRFLNPWIGFCSASGRCFSTHVVFSGLR